VGGLVAERTRDRPARPSQSPTASTVRAVVVVRAARLTLVAPEVAENVVVAPAGILELAPVFQVLVLAAV
jgi:hypothetical protein